MNKLYFNSSGGGIAGTLGSNYYKGCGIRRGHEREFVIISDEKDTDGKEILPMERGHDKWDLEK